MPNPNMIPRFIASRGSDCPDAYLVLRGPSAPVLFVVHGISRNAAEIAARFAENPAFNGWNIVAPLFEKGRFGKYQQMVARPGQTRSDIAMLALAAAMRDDYGLDCDLLSLFGFSGGAQFVHRFAMLYPEYVRSVVSVSAGWYLMPQQDLPWPFGMGEGCPAEPRLRAALSVPMTVIVGDHDLRIDGSVRQTPMINMLQGDTRLRRAKRWTKAMKAAANELGQPSCVNLRLLANGVHDFGICARSTDMLNIVADTLVGGNKEIWPLTA
ncbi:MAG: alpha/beta hydrolase [Sphingopyxis sp.]|nr:alpha/beta hydrolase [Sphingopyxis sp.]